MKDIYWHIQMHLPEGKGGAVIDSKKMLLENPPVIGTGEWDDKQCRNFKGEDNGMQIGDIVMVRIGNMPLALCEILDNYFTDDELEEEYINKLYRHVKILDWNTTKEKNSLFSQGTLKPLYKGNNTDSWHYINNWYKKVLKNNKMNNLIDILKAKHQIILQGAPGTGKTYTAKKIACELTKKGEVISLNSEEISEINIPNYFREGQTINSSKNRTSYTIKGVKEKAIVIGGDDIKDRDISFTSIKEAYKEKLWEPGKQKNGLDPYTSSLAKYIHEHIANTKNNESFMKLVQFHPSYTYEDFVRGIVVETETGTANYKSVDKTLGLFAKEALKNWKDNKKRPEVLSKEKWVEEILQQFKEQLQEKLENGEVIELKKGNKPTITALDDDAFRCNRYNNPLDSFPMKDKDIVYGYIGLYLENPSVKIKDNPNLSGSARSGMYYLYQNLIALFKKYLDDENISYTNSGVNQETVKEQNYVLIIDEINRANLPAVLGELIYALEYRGEYVEGMYAVDGENKLVLPPNLYIIGTMNTADRSVGQIDYAIRRRFAFIDMLPHALDDVDGFDYELFESVSKLFIENYDEYKSNHQTTLKRSEHLSEEFRPEDVWLGHSYFIMQKDGKNCRDMRLNYEIKPILKEYLKDGIFKESAEKLINSLA